MKNEEVDVVGQEKETNLLSFPEESRVVNMVREVRNGKTVHYEERSSAKFQQPTGAEQRCRVRRMLSALACCLVFLQAMWYIVK